MLTCSKLESFSNGSKYVIALARNACAHRSRLHLDIIPTQRLPECFKRL
jgi:hypothetical protein